MKRRSIGNRNFRPKARKVARPNRWVVQRGGIRL